MKRQDIQNLSLDLQNITRQAERRRNQLVIEFSVMLKARLDEVPDDIILTSGVDLSLFVNMQT